MIDQRLYEITLIGSEHKLDSIETDCREYAEELYPILRQNNPTARLWVKNWDSKLEVYRPTILD